MRLETIDRELTGEFSTMRGLPSEWAQEVAAEAVDLHGAMQKRTELARLLDLVRPMGFSTLLEVGALAGGTTWALRQCLDNPLVVTVDNLVLGYRVSSAIADVVVTGESGQARQEVVAGLAGRTVDLLFIDADHSYEAVKADYAAYAPLVRPGGCVVFHDVSVPHLLVDVHDVVRFWNEIRLGRRHATIFEPLDGEWTTERDWGGLGVLVA